MRSCSSESGFGLLERRAAERAKRFKGGALYPPPLLRNVCLRDSALYGFRQLGKSAGAPKILFKDGDRELLTMSSDISGIDPESLNQVYQLAKRLALNIDQNIDEALNDIKDL